MLYAQKKILCTTYQEREWERDRDIPKIMNE